MQGRCSIYVDTIVPIGRHGIRLGRAKQGESGALGYLACLQFVLHVYFGLDGANGFCEYSTT